MAVTPRRSLLAGALLVALGLAIAGTAPIPGTDGSERTSAQQVVGGIAVFVGWAVLAWAIHRSGREADER
jgi:hypothetical protein